MIRAEAEPLPEGTPGRGRIVVTGIGAPPGAIAFTLRREGYQLGCLGPRGWQATEEALRAERVAAVPEVGGWAIVLGPDLVRHLRPAPYLLGLPALGEEVAVFWPDGIEMPVAPQDLLPPPRRATPPQRWPEPLPDPALPRAADPAPQQQRAAPSPPRRPWAWIALGAVLPLAVGGFALRDTLFGALPTPAPVARPATVPAPPPWPEGTDSLPLCDLVAIPPDAAGIRIAAERRQRAGRNDDALAAALLGANALPRPGAAQPARPPRAAGWRHLARTRPRAGWPDRGLAAGSAQHRLAAQPGACLQQPRRARARHVLPRRRDSARSG